MKSSIPSLGLVDALNATTSKIFVFEGRSRRSEFWWTQLIVCLVSIILTPIAGTILGWLTIPLKFRRLHDIGKSGWWWGIGALLQVAFYLCLIFDIMMSALNSKVLSDYQTQLYTALILKYGIFLLVIVGYQVLLLIFYCTDGHEEENKYGLSPKYIDDDKNDGFVNERDKDDTF